MLFVELRFVLFFLLVFGVYWALRGNTLRKAWLLAASYGFYAAFDYRFLSLVAVSTAVDYAVGLALGRTERPWRRRLLLLASLVTNLGILAYFKYADFFVGSAERLLTAFGLEADWPTLNLVLPIGISFYTFQTLSYTIDVYRGKLEPTRNVLNVALFVGFFPQLAAGPIVRATEFLPQTLVRHAWQDVRVRACLVLVLVGYLQKAVLADNLAPVVDRYFANPEAYGSGAAWIGSFGFWAQIYGDFAGYSNMAVGMAGLLGYRLPRNFDFPFVSRSAAEFWSRWHITLSSWINDYVLRPLRRPGQSWAWYCASIVFAMTLFGLWHGAAWKFVVWGALNGVAVAGYRTWRRRLRPRGAPGIPVAAAAVSVALTLAAVTLTLPLFRAASFAEAWHVIGSMLLVSDGGGETLTGFAGRLAEPGLALLLGGLFLLHLALSRGHGRWVVHRLPAVGFAAAYGVTVPVALALTPSALEPFIYFQF